MDRLAHFREKQTEAEAEQLDGSHQTCSESPGPAASAPPKPVHRARSREQQAQQASTTRRCCSSSNCPTRPSQEPLTPFPISFGLAVNSIGPFQVDL